MLVAVIVTALACGITVGALYRPLLLTVNNALEKLEALDERQARLVELRFFGGHSIEEAADLMGISASTAKREWKFVRAWLKNEILKDSGSAEVSLPAAL